MPTLDRTPFGPLEAVALADGDLRAVFVPGAGMIGCSLKHRGEELLVQRGGIGAWRGTGRSFGLPLLHPWANRLRDWRYAAAGRAVTIDRSRGTVRADENGLPIHGALAAAEDWDVVDAGADAGSAWLAASLEYGRRDDRLAVFPFPHTLELQLRLAGDALTITTTVATRDDVVPLAFGWHPWLSLPGVPRADWEIAVEWAGGYRYAQVFAPTALDVACLEPMMAPVAALSTGEDLEVAQPGERVSATFRVRVTQRPP